MARRQGEGGGAGGGIGWVTAHVAQTGAMRGLKLNYLLALFVNAKYFLFEAKKIRPGEKNQGRDQAFFFSNNHEDI